MYLQNFSNILKNLYKTLDKLINVNSNACIDKCETN